MDAERIVQLATGPAIATGGDDCILVWNDSARELLAYPRGHPVAGESFHRLVAARDSHGNPISAGHLPFYEMVTCGEAPRSYELEVRSATGSYLRVAVSVVVVLQPEPGRYELVYFLRRILRRRQADEAIERLLAQSQGEAPSLSSPGATARSTPGNPLTGRQTEVLRLVAQGKSSRQIAAALGVSLHTARRHIQNILLRLEAHSKAEAVSRAFQGRLL